MIAVKRIADVNYDDYDEIWAIVRSLKNPNEHIKQVADLSPSWDLFKKYRALKEQENWNEITFHDIYVPQFLHEMHGPNQVRLLNELYNIDKTGDSICLTCFCPDEELCHRSIIAGLLQGVGCNVTGVHADYSHYFEQWNSDEIKRWKG